MQSFGARTTPATVMINDAIANQLRRSGKCLGAQPPQLSVRAGFRPGPRLKSENPILTPACQVQVASSRIPGFRWQSPCRPDIPSRQPQAAGAESRAEGAAGPHLASSRCLAQTCGLRGFGGCSPPLSAAPPNLHCYCTDALIERLRK